MSEINLINPALWQHEFPWGTIVNQGTSQEIAIVKYLVEWGMDEVRLNVRHSPNKPYMCWKRDQAWNKIYTKLAWGIGHMVSIKQFLYGHFTFVFRLPNFRGAWPAVWMIDTTPTMGCPPEIDVFEHFRKDGFLSRFHITGTYHGGRDYANDLTIQKKFTRCMGLVPLDKKDIMMELIWTPEGITWIFNDKVVMEVPATSPRFPTQPMNLIIGNGVGLEWHPDTNTNPFILKECTYSPAN